MDFDLHNNDFPESYSADILRSFIMARKIDTEYGYFINRLELGSSTTSISENSLRLIIRDIAYEDY
jgi:hypothetical protein